MSLLELIKKKQSTLNTTSTRVTQPDGRCFLEDKGHTVEVTRANYGFVVDTKPDNVPAKVIENLYLGSQDCCEWEVLQQHNITYVLSVGIQPPCTFPKVQYKFVQCLDLPEVNIVDVLAAECVPFINDCIKCNSNVLVHCNAGVSRSSAIVIGYLIFVKKYSYSEAYDIVKNVRNCIKPNSGFEKQLKMLVT